MYKKTKPPLYLEDGQLNKKYIRLLKHSLLGRFLPIGQPYRTAIFQCDDCLLFFDNPHLMESHQKGHKHKGYWMISITIYADLTCKIDKTVCTKFPKVPEEEIVMQYGTCTICEKQMTEENAWAEHICKGCARKSKYII